MPRPTSKTDLLAAIEKEHGALENYLDTLPPTEMTIPNTVDTPQHDAPADIPGGHASPIRSHADVGQAILGPTEDDGLPGPIHAPDPRCAVVGGRDHEATVGAEHDVVDGLLVASKQRRGKDCVGRLAGDIQPAGQFR